jgi:hypothetical protein
MIFVLYLQLKQMTFNTQHNESSYIMEQLKYIHMKYKVLREMSNLCIDERIGYLKSFRDLLVRQRLGSLLILKMYSLLFIVSFSLFIFMAYQLENIANPFILAIFLPVTSGFGWIFYNADKIIIDNTKLSKFRLFGLMKQNIDKGCVSEEQLKNNFG